MAGSARPQRFPFLYFSWSKISFTFRKSENFFWRRKRYAVSHAQQHQCWSSLHVWQPYFWRFLSFYLEGYNFIMFDDTTSHSRIFAKILKNCEFSWPFSLVAGNSSESNIASITENVPTLISCASVSVCYDPKFHSWMHVLRSSFVE